MSGIRLEGLIKEGFQGLHGVFHSISNGITVTDESSKILYVNPAFTKITGYSAQEALGQNPGMLHSGKHDKTFFENMWREIKNDGAWSGEIWNRHKEGGLIPEILTITKIKGAEGDFYIGVFADISTVVEKNNERLKYAFTDPLTSLYNRRYLPEAFKFIAQQYEREGYQRTYQNDLQSALIFLDIDKFKTINDKHGHLAGDAALTHVSDAITDTIRKTDMAIRYGGDEFIILLNRIPNREYVLAICERINSLLEVPLQYDNESIHVSVSMGVAMYPEEADKLDDLIHIADTAMYEAKQSDMKIVFNSED